jgi:hypothetical protein
MARIQRLEIELGMLWRQGRVSGELHLGIGEEAAVAGVVDHLVEGDSLALDHRSTRPLVARGTDPAALVLEVLGAPGGLCRGWAATCTCLTLSGSRRPRASWARPGRWHAGSRSRPPSCGPARCRSRPSAKGQ